VSEAPEEAPATDAPDNRPVLILQPRRFQAPPLPSTSRILFYALKDGQWHIAVGGTWYTCEKP
jgi:hypothetical protein